LVSKRRRLRRKDQAIAEVDSDKATLELPAEASGIITLKAEEGDAVAVETVVCLIDTAAAKPSGSLQLQQKQHRKQQKLKSRNYRASSKQHPAATSGTPSPAARKY
jgi:2-oxoglutarate dehydrogenase E2 component (dihydrolipoamide succinyltransferase)